METPLVAPSANHPYPQKNHTYKYPQPLLKSLSFVSHGNDVHSCKIALLFLQALSFLYGGGAMWGIGAPSSEVSRGERPCPPPQLLPFVSFLPLPFISMLWHEEEPVFPETPLARNHQTPQGSGKPYSTDLSKDNLILNFHNPFPWFSVYLVPHSHWS